MTRRRVSYQTRQKRREREFIQFLRWLEDGPKPWLEPHLRRWRARWERWEYLHRRHRDMSGALEFITNAFSADEYALKKAFYYVKRMQYVEVEKKGQQLMLALTDQGRAKLMAHGVHTARLLPRSQVLFVIFDIPETQHRARNNLRYYLKEHGFKRLQHSVWCSRYDLRELLSDFVHANKLERWIQVGLATFSTKHPLLES